MFYHENYIHPLRASGILPAKIIAHDECSNAWKKFLLLSPTVYVCVDEPVLCRFSTSDKNLLNAYEHPPKYNYLFCPP